MSKARGQSRELVVVEGQGFQGSELAKALWQSRELIALEAAQAQERPTAWLH